MDAFGQLINGSVHILLARECKTVGGAARSHGLARHVILEADAEGGFRFVRGGGVLHEDELFLLFLGDVVKTMFADHLQARGFEGIIDAWLDFDVGFGAVDRLALYNGGVPIFIEVHAFDNHGFVRAAGA